MNTRSDSNRARPDAPELLACTRFGLRVRDRGWLLHRLELIAAITAPSLMAQSDQGFHWAVLIDDGLPEDIRERLDEIIAPFGNRSLLCKRTHHGPGSMLEIAREQLGLSEDQPLLTGRLDDDDAWSTTMVDAVRNHAQSWLNTHDRPPGLTFTFQDGLEWVMYEMLDIEHLMDSGEQVMHLPSPRKYSLPFIGTSVFVCGPLSVGGTTISGSHPKVAENLSASKGFGAEVLPTEEPMWLCCRHKQAGSGIRKAQGAELHIDFNELAGQFGIDEERVQRYLDNADKHQYTLLKAPLTKKGQIIREWLQTKQRLNDPEVESSDLPALKQKLDDLAFEMSRLEKNALGDPGSVS